MSICRSNTLSHMKRTQKIWTDHREVELKKRLGLKRSISEIERKIRYSQSEFRVQVHG